MRSSFVTFTYKASCLYKDIAKIFLYISEFLYRVRNPVDFCFNQSGLTAASKTKYNDLLNAVREGIESVKNISAGRRKKSRLRNIREWIGNTSVEKLFRLAWHVQETDGQPSGLKRHPGKKKKKKKIQVNWSTPTYPFFGVG